MLNLRRTLAGGAAVLAGLTLSHSASAADWSDTSIGWRYGTRFHEPFDLNPGGGAKNITKNIYSLTHVSGYKYGTNFFNVDLLQSNSADPSANSSGNANPGTGAQEVYVVYRNTLDFGKISGKDLKWGYIRGWGATFGFDWNTKNDLYQSKKRMLVLGPTVMFDVPGFLNVSLLALDESNAPWNISSRYTYRTHAALSSAWGIPIGSWPLSFEGFGLWIASKGNNEYGGPTAAEVNIDTELMLDLGAVVGGPKQTFKVGLEYQYWRNKFGNPTNAGDPGATAKTPMVRAEYHF